MQRILFVFLIILLMFSPLFALDSLNISRVNLMHIDSGSRYVTNSGDYLYVTSGVYYNEPSVYELSVFDVSDIANTHRVSQLILPLRYLWYKAVSGDLMVASYEYGVAVFDVADPEDPTLLTTFETAEIEIKSIEFQENIAYIGTNNRKIYSLDLSDLDSPTIADSVEISFVPTYLQFDDDLLFAGGEGFTVIDVSSPENLTSGDTLNLLTELVIPLEDAAILIGRRSGVTFLDISDPNEFAEHSYLDIKSGSYMVARNDTLFVMCEIQEEFWDDYGRYTEWIPHMAVYNISDLEHPAKLRDYEYYFDYYDYLYVNDYLISRGYYSTLQDDDRHELFHPLTVNDAVATYHNQLLLCINDSLWAHSLENPANPAVVSNAPLLYSASKYKVCGDYLIAAYDTRYREDEAFRIYDLSSGYNTYLDFKFEDYYGGYTMTPDGYFYLTYDGRLYAYDVSDNRQPQNPVIVDFDLSNYSNLTYHNDVLYWPASSQGLVAVNVSIRNAPREIYQYETPGGAREVAIVGDLCIVMESKSRAEDGVRILDISNPEMPEELSYLEMPGTCVEMEVHDSTAIISTFIGDYDDESYPGIYLVDFSDYMNPEIVGYYETFDTDWEFCAIPHYIYTNHAVYYIPDLLGVDQPPKLLMPSYNSLAVYPNPFNSTSMVTFDLPQTGNFKLNLFDLNGRRLWEVANGAGVQNQSYSLPLDATRLPSGKYMLLLENDDASMTYSITLVK